MDVNGGGEEILFNPVPLLTSPKGYCPHVIPLKTEAPGGSVNFRIAQLIRRARICVHFLP